MKLAPASNCAAVSPGDLDFLFLGEPCEGRAVLEDGLDDARSGAQTVLEPVQQAALRVDGPDAKNGGDRDRDRQQRELHVSPRNGVVVVFPDSRVAARRDPLHACAQ